MRRCRGGKCGVILSIGDKTMRIISRRTCSIVRILGHVGRSRAIRALGSPRATRTLGGRLKRGCSRGSLLSVLRTMARLARRKHLFAGSVCRDFVSIMGRHGAIIGTLYLRVTRSYGLTYGCYFTRRKRCRNHETLVSCRINGGTLSFLVTGSKAEEGLRISFFNNRPLVG